jgi:hypothetical protein
MRLNRAFTHVVEEGSTKVARHDDDGVTEVHDTALAIGQAAIVEDLQEKLHELPCGLFDFVDEHNRIGLATDVLGELATLVVTNIAGWCTDKACDGMLLRVLRTVDTNHRLRRVEENCGELQRKTVRYMKLHRIMRITYSLGHKCLTGTRRTSEQEARDRTGSVPQTTTAETNRVGDSLHRLGLTDDTLSQNLLHPQQLLLLRAHQASSRDAGPPSDDLSNLVWSDSVAACLGLLLLSFGFELRETVLQVGKGIVPKVGSCGQIVPTLSLVGLGLELVDLPANVVDLLSTRLLSLVRRQERLELVINVGDGFAGDLETLLRGLVLLPFESVDLDLEFELAALKLVNSFRSSFSGDTNAAEYYLVSGYR